MTRLKEIKISQARSHSPTRRIWRRLLVTYRPYCFYVCSVELERSFRNEAGTQDFLQTACQPSSQHMHVSERMAKDYTEYGMVVITTGLDGALREHRRWYWVNACNSPTFWAEFFADGSVTGDENRLRKTDLRLCERGH